MLPGWFYLVLSVLVSVLLVPIAKASTPPPETTLSSNELKKFETIQYIPPEIAQIQAAENRSDYALAKRLEDSLISRPNESFSTKWEGSWIKALALKARFEDRQMLGDSHKQIFGDLLLAAQLGNLEAIRQAEDLLEEYLAGMNPDEYPQLTDDDILSIYKIGADFADPPSAITYGSGVTQLLHAQLPGDLSPEERIFWMTLGFVSDIQSPRDQRKMAVDYAVKTFGLSKVSAGLSRYGWAGGLTGPSAKVVPGRDVYSAFEAELDLRAEYSISYGAGMPPAGSPEPEMSARELFDDESIMMRDAGLGGLYLIVPTTVAVGNSHIIMVPRSDLISTILPDDKILVRCGPLSHVAVVYKIDVNEDSIWLVDPLYEYWQPSHNTCISHFSLVDGPDHGYLVVVSAKEVEATLLGVIAARADVSVK